jgi:hypothetical protein
MYCLKTMTDDSNDLFCGFLMPFDLKNNKIYFLCRFIQYLCALFFLRV